MDHLDLEITNDLAELARIADAVESFGSMHGIPQNVVNDMNLSLDEVLNNIISYAYDDEGAHKILLTLMLRDQDFIATVYDDGKPFDPLLTMQTELSKKDPATGGVGLRFVKALMDEINYVRDVGRNCLELKKRCRTDTP